MKTFITGFLFILLNAGFLPAQKIPGYSIVNKIHLPGDGGWDYLSVDESGGRLFVSHGSVVQVVDLKSGKLIGTINDTPGVHGIALAPGLNKAFISVGRSAFVKVIDFKTLAVVTDIKVTGENPDAIMYDQFSNKVFVFNGRTSNATVIDASSDAVTGTIALAGKPEFPVSDGKGNIYVNIEDKGIISVINVKTLQVEKSWPISPGEDASGLAIDNETHRLFTVCGNKLMMILDSDDGHIVAKLPIGDGCDGVKFDAGLKRAYSSNGEGNMTVVQEIDKDNFKIVETIPTMQGARTLAVDGSTHHIYTPSAEFDPAPAATADNPHPRRSAKPDSFLVMDIAPSKK
jgi:DNA-binding beta-propeller fold protein YncE